MFLTASLKIQIKYIKIAGVCFFKIKALFNILNKNLINISLFFYNF